MTKAAKILIALGIAVLLGLGAALIYSFFGAEEEGGRERRSFLQFPGGGGSEKSGTTVGLGSEIPVKALEVLNLKQLTREPAIGAALAPDEKDLLFYKREGGNLFKMNIESGAEERISGLTVVGIAEVQWSPKRDAAIVAYIDGGNVKRFIQTAATSSQTYFLSGRFTSTAWAPDGKTIAAGEVTASGFRMVTMDPRGGSLRSIFTSPIPDWRASWPAQNSLLLVTPGTYFQEGISSLLSLSTRRATEFVYKRALGVLPNPAKPTYAVFSADENGSLQPLEFRDPKRAIAAAPVRTLAEKCVWNTRGTLLYCAVPAKAEPFLPDDWYKGKVTFSDRIVRIDASTGATEEVVQSSTIDAISLFLDSKEENLYFINKADSSVWRARLEALKAEGI